MNRCWVVVIEWLAGEPMGARFNAFVFPAKSMRLMGWTNMCCAGILSADAAQWLFESLPAAIACGKIRFDVQEDCWL